MVPPGPGHDPHHHISQFLRTRLSTLQQLGDGVPSLMDDALILGADGADILVPAAQRSLVRGPLLQNSIRPGATFDDPVQGAAQVPHARPAEEVTG